MRPSNLIPIFCLLLQIVHSLPTPSEGTGSVIPHPDSNAHLLPELRTYMKYFIMKCYAVTNETLNQIPNTKAYETSRDKLKLYLEKIQETTERLDKCSWNLLRIPYTLSVPTYYFERPEATPEEKETYELLLKNGLEDLFLRDEFEFNEKLSEKMSPAVNRSEFYC